MFHPRLRRLTTLGLLVAYLTASTLGGLLHEGLHHDHDEAVPVEGTGYSSADVAGASIGAADGHSAHGDDCTICRFLGQRSLVLAICPLGNLCQLSVELSLTGASQTVTPLARTTHSRAPPLVG
ncbi:MAG TPA: hypothetical protein VGZ26_03105 [Pirellulales bacterium]|nr:hypothetical protein [Pirellulales bacterium]